MKEEVSAELHQDLKAENCRNAGAESKAKEEG
jgi:hypothetical protein